MADETPARTRKPRPEGRTKRPEGEARPEVTARDLLYMIARASNGFEAILKTKEPALSLSQWAMLEMLAKEGGSARPSQVGKKLAFSRQHVRLAAKKLMKLELIAATAPEEGQKAVGLALTDAGRAQLTAIEGATDALAAALKEDKRGGGLASASRSLKVLTAAIVAQLPKDEPRAKTAKAKDGQADAAEGDA